MVLPEILYEPYPYATMLIGVIAAFNAANIVMLVCGVLLVIVSGIILKMRRDYRRLLAEVGRGARGIRIGC